MHYVAVLLALLSAFCIAIGMVSQYRVATDVPTEHGMSLVGAVALVRSPLWWAGTVSIVIGYGFQALALAYGPLLLVQPLAVSCLLFVLPMGARLAHRRVALTEWAWALLLTGGLAVFIPLVRPNAVLRPPLLSWMFVAVVLVPLVSACIVVASRSRGRRRAVLLAVASAVMFGILAVLTKVSLVALRNGDLSSMLAIPAPYVLVALAVAGTVLKNAAYNAGALQVSVPTMLVLEQVTAVTLGVVVLGEDLAVSTSSAVVLSIALVAMVSATIALGRREGAVEEEFEAASGRRREGAITPPTAGPDGAP
jgi:hypothetical protein